MTTDTGRYREGEERATAHLDVPRAALGAAFSALEMMPAIWHVSSLLPWPGENSRR
jgi:hypothetical protein